jgi:hypothetical protein
MVELSAKHSPFVKRVFPFVVVLLVTVWTYWSRLLASKPVSLLTVGFTLIALSTILVFVLRRGLWSRADTVQDLGDWIRVTRWRHTVQLLLQDISRVRIEPGTVGHIVTLELARPCALGSEITFFAASSRRMPTIDSDLQSLVNRVATRNKRNAD